MTESIDQLRLVRCSVFSGIQVLCFWISDCPGRTIAKLKEQRVHCVEIFGLIKGRAARTWVPYIASVLFFIQPSSSSQNLQPSDTPVKSVIFWDVVAGLAPPISLLAFLLRLLSTIGSMFVPCSHKEELLLLKDYYFPFNNLCTLLQ